MRAPTTPAERLAMEKAYESKDPFAIARWEQPGCRYVRIVDQRTRGNLGLSFIVAIRPDAKPAHQCPLAYEFLDETQTFPITDALIASGHEPTARPEPGA